MKITANKLTKLRKQKHQTQRKQKSKTKYNTSQMRTLRKNRQPTDLRNRTIKNNHRVKEKQELSNAISKTPVLDAIRNISKTSTSPKPGSLLAHAHSALLIKGGKKPRKKTGKKTNQKRSSKNKSKKNKIASVAATTKASSPTPSPSPSPSPSPTMKVTARP